MSTYKHKEPVTILFLINSFCANVVNRVALTWESN